jgi:hypothetical protein
MIPYHGLPITPDAVALAAIKGGHAFVSFRQQQQLDLAIEACQSFAVDNGAFTAWASGHPVTDWSDFYTWAEDMRRVPNCDFAVIPDVIDGDEAANDALLAQWPLPRSFGAPVWHMHESLDRLVRLVYTYPRVCLGSSGEFKTVGAAPWQARMREAMAVCCDERGRPMTRLHGLRMLNPKVFTEFPFASADSTNIGRNVGIDTRWKTAYPPATKAGRAALMRERIEAFNSPATFTA